MASLQELKNNLSGKTPLSTSKKLNKDISSTKKPLLDDNFSKTQKTDLFGLEEARYLLTLIAKTDFAGKDVQTVYNIAVKLQNIIKENLTEDNG